MFGGEPLRLSTLITLVDADPGDAPDRLKDIFTWRYERELDRAKTSIGVALSLLAGLLVSALKEELRAAGWAIGLASAGAFAVGAYGLWLHRRLDRSDAAYANLLQLLAALSCRGGSA